MAFSQSDLDALERAIAMGVTKVQFQDRVQEFRSLDEMLRIRDLIRKDLGQFASGNQRIYPKLSKGF